LPTPRPTYNQNALTAADLYPVGITTAVIIGVTVAVAVVIKKRQPSTEAPGTSNEPEFI
jgi:hypothetical protein